MTGVICYGHRGTREGAQPPGCPGVYWRWVNISKAGRWVAYGRSVCTGGAFSTGSTSQCKRAPLPLEV